MRLSVTTKKGVYQLTAKIVASAVVACLVITHVFVHVAIPADFPESRELLITLGYILSLIGSIGVGTPFSLMVSKSLLQAHQLQLHIVSMSLTDHLTGLPNRAAVLGKIEVAIAVGLKHGKTGTALFVDLDHFKKINDTYGHAGGDAALRHAADIMRTTLGPNAVMGRFGGEEFVCFIEDSADAPAIAAQIIMALRESTVRYGDQTIAVKASIGLANTDGSGNVEHLLSQADEALYIAKSSGRDCIVSYDEVALLRMVAASIDKPLRRRATDNIEHLAQRAA